MELQKRINNTYMKINITQSELAKIIDILQWVMESDTSNIDIEGLYEARLKLQDAFLANIIE